MAAMDTPLTAESTHRHTVDPHSSSHSHNITSVTAPLGGYETYCKFGYNGDHLFNWLQDAGMRELLTYYTLLAMIWSAETPQSTQGMRHTTLAS